MDDIFLAGANGIYFTGMTLEGAPYHGTEIALFLVAAVLYIASFQFLARTGTPTFGEKGQVRWELGLLLPLLQLQLLLYTGCC